MSTTQRVIEDRVIAEDGTANRVVERPAWSPAQFVLAAAGVFLVVVGGVGLARTGIHLTAATIPLAKAQVLGLGFSSLSALVQLVAGVIMVAGAVAPSLAKSDMWFFGVVLVAWGLIVAIDPTAFATTWGYVRADGVAYAVIGAVLIVAAAVSPTIWSRRRRVRSVARTTAEPLAR